MTGDYVTISDNSTRGGARAVQAPYAGTDGRSYPAPNQTFCLHPTPQ
ncbi:hypothetical protein ACH4NF_02140 [Streptomyces sp. NPDC017248]